MTASFIARARQRPGELIGGVEYACLPDPPHLIAGPPYGLRTFEITEG